MLKIIENLMDKLRVAEPVVEFDEEGVTRHLSRTKTESVRWEELREVVLVTTDEGPFVEDVYWMLIGEFDETGMPTSGCLLPQQAVHGELLDRLLGLPGFDYERFIEAMGSTSNESFVCWRHPSREATTIT